MPTTLTSVPDDCLSVVSGYIGFHSLPVASTVCKAWRGMVVLTRARALHRLSVAAAPAALVGSRQLLNTDEAREYLSLAPRPRSRRPDGRPYRGAPMDVDHGPPIFCTQQHHDAENLEKIFSPASARCVFRTVINEGGSFPFVIEINKYTGSVLVYEHPEVDDEGKEFGLFSNAQFNRFMKGRDVEQLTLLERYEPVGVFIGISCRYQGWGPPSRAQFGDSILLQMPVTDDVNPKYPYIAIGGSCKSFETPEPITRFFANISHHHSMPEVMLSERYVYLHAGATGLYSEGQSAVKYDKRNRKGVSCIHGGPYYVFSNHRDERDMGEGAWEFLMMFDNGPATMKRLEAVSKHVSPRLNSGPRSCGRDFGWL